MDRDEDEEITPPNWSDAKLISKARVKHYSTKRVSKHHLEEYEIDFEKMKTMMTKKLTEQT